MDVVPAIYVRLGRTPQLNPLQRLLALSIAGAAMAVLITAAWLRPDIAGYGTHTQLGLQPCGFLMRTGIPCAGCGMTTSFAYLVRGRMISSFVAQPFGMILCILTAASFWAALYIALTGRPAYRLLATISPRFHALFWIPLAGAAWLWKIALVVG